MIFTEKEQREIALMNIEHFSNFEQYSNTYNLNKDEFKEEMEKGFIQEILTSTDNSKLSDEDMLQAIQCEVSESSFKELYFEIENKIKDYNNSDWLREYTEVYKVFTIGNILYVDMD